MAVSEQIIQVIDALCEKFGIAINWTSENVFPYIETLCKKLVMYEIVTSIFYVAIATLLIIGVILLTKKFTPVFKKGLEEQDYLDIGWTVGTVFAIIGLVIFSIVIISVFGQQITDIIKCTVFPEMYIFKYISKLISAT